MSREHELKTWPGPFAAILDGRKRFEIRKNDRGFAEGDSLHLREWDPTTDPPRYTGREVRAQVTYLVPGGNWGLPDALCVMSIEPSSSTAPRADAIPPPDDSGPPCDACKGRGWFVGDCHPREVCGTCNGTGRPQSWAAQEIVRLDREIARLRCAALAPRQPSDPLPVRTRRRLSGEELQAAMERANPRPSLEDMNLDEPARQPSEPPAMGWKLTGNVVEPVAAPARQPSEMLLGAGYSGGGMSVHAIDPADRSRSLCGATMTSTIGEAFDPTSKHACPRCVAARQPSDTDTARCPTGTCAVDSPRITETGCWCCGAKAGEPCRHVPDWARPSGTARCPKCAGPTEFATLHRDGSRRRFFVCTDPSCGGGVWLPSPPSSTTPEKP